MVIETTKQQYTNLSQSLAGLTGGLITFTGDMIDIDVGGRLGGRLMGTAGITIDVYFKSTDKDGFTVQDAASVGGGFIGGIITGMTIGAMGGNPVTAALGGLIGGAVIGTGIDKLAQIDPRAGPVSTAEKTPNGDLELRTHQLIGTEFVDGKKYAVLHTTITTVNELGNIVEVSQVRTLVNDGYATLDQIRSAYEGNGLLDQCFPGSTSIQISETETCPISSIRVGDTVMAFDPSQNMGRGALVPRKVVRLYRGVTQEWVRLTWVEGSDRKELITTPGHNFLNRFGTFSTIEEMLQDNSTTLVLASGAFVEVSAERITYGHDNAHMFEKAQQQGVMLDSSTLESFAPDGWQTYNFEVEDLHTYVAGEVRVHNES